MAQEDLFTALNMLKSGVNELQLSRTLQGANDQVQQIRAAEASDADKRTALTNLSHDLVARMGALGAPLDQIQAQAGAVAPPTFGSGMDMYRQGLLTNNSGLQQMGLTAQKQEEQPAMDKERMQLAVMAPFRKMVMDQKLNEQFTKHVTDLNNKIDPNSARFGNIAKLQGVNNQIATMEPMLNDPSQWTPTAMKETVRKLDSTLAQGASTVAGSQELSPKIADMYATEAKQLISNKPEVMSSALEWQKYYKNTFARIKDINDRVMKESQLNYTQGEVPALLRQFPDRKGDIEAALSSKIGEPVVIDPATKSVDLASNIATQDQYAQALQKAASTPNDPRVSAVVGALAQDPRNMQRVLLRYPSLRKTWGSLRSGK